MTLVWFRKSRKKFFEYNKDIKKTFTKEYGVKWKGR